MNNNWKEEFDAKYGYEYPRCALIMKNVEVRDEKEDLIGHTDTAAVTPDEIKSFIESLLSSQRKEWVKMIRNMEDDISDELYNWDAYPSSGKQAHSVIQMIIDALSKEE